MKYCDDPDHCTYSDCPTNFCDKHKPEHPTVQYGPWILKQRPAGDWVVDQYDYTKNKTRRCGPYATKEEAQEIYDALHKPAESVASWIA